MSKENDDLCRLRCIVKIASVVRDIEDELAPCEQFKFNEKKHLTIFTNWADEFIKIMLIALSGAEEKPEENLTEQLISWFDSEDILLKNSILPLENNYHNKMVKTLAKISSAVIDLKAVKDSKSYFDDIILTKSTNLLKSGFLSKYFITYTDEYVVLTEFYSELGTHVMQ